MPDNEAEFGGLVAAVTGGASGIGRAVAEELDRLGAQVFVLDRAEPDDPRPRVTSIVCDVSRRDEVDEAMTRIDTCHGRLDVLVNNAGIEARGRIDEISDEQLARVFDVNVSGTFRTTRAAMPLLRRSMVPSIVNTCSVAALRGMPGLGLYSASKGAILAFTRSLAADLLDEGIRVNCVCPGTVDTPWVKRQLDAARDPKATRRALEARQPMRRLISADEVARAVVYLASPRSASVTGTALEVDGGLLNLSLAGHEAITRATQQSP